MAEWITSIINVFGLDAHPEPNQIGWSGIDIPEAAKAFIYPLSTLRDEVRRQAIAGTVSDPISTSKVDTTFLSTTTFDPAAAPYQAAYTSFITSLSDLLADASTSPKTYLALCDTLRDTTLWNLSIHLEDRDAAPALVRPLNSSLRLERANRDSLAALKLQKASDAKAKAAADEKERLEKGKLSHLDMFRTSEFSQWDEEGLPVMDAEGKEVAKSRSKKLRKEWERQRKLHEAWLASGAQP